MAQLWPTSLPCLFTSFWISTLIQQVTSARTYYCGSAYNQLQTCRNESTNCCIYTRAYFTCCPDSVYYNRKGLNEVYGDPTVIGTIVGGVLGGIVLLIIIIFIIILACEDCKMVYRYRTKFIKKTAPEPQPVSRANSSIQMSPLPSTANEAQPSYPWVPSKSKTKEPRPFFTKPLYEDA